MWEIRATYDDGMELEEYRGRDTFKSEEDDQQDLEEYAINYHEGCNWFSVNWANE